MIFPVGSLINAAAVSAGGVLGMRLGHRLPDRMRLIVYQGLGLCVLAIGLQLALKSGNPLYMVGSILVGAVIGEALRIEEALAKGGEAIKRALKSGNARFTEGLVSTSLVVCIGSLAILGPLEEGLGGDRTLVLTKAMLDFFIAVAFGATYGSGVIFAAIPLFIYQGVITVLAASIQPYLTEGMRAELAASGGIMVMGIGINLLEIKKIRLSNLLPALPIVVVLYLIAG